MLTLYQRLKKADIEFKGDLSFVNDWDFFMPEPSKRLENLVPTGPYAGTLEAFETGTKLRGRYEHLLYQALEQNQTSLWASGSKRVIDTARYFATGFYGIDWEDTATLHVIPETSDLGADTLTAGDTCKNYAENIDTKGHDYGYKMLGDFQSSYLPSIADRLHSQNPKITFTNAEIYIMQEMCGFEILSKGKSPWCDVFTHAEWRQFEYARDVLHYYRAGAGNKYGANMGWLLLNATTNLLSQGPEAGPLYFSFVHDGDIVPFLAALNLFPEPQHLPTNAVLINRKWATSTVTPMGGRIILERLACPAPQNCWSSTPLYPNHVYCDPPHDDYFVRININDGIVALPGCDSGPGSSCPLANFMHHVKLRGEHLGDFRQLCGLDEGAADHITFLHQ